MIDTALVNGGLETWQVAYAAGFFDGEGHIRIVQHSKRCRTLMLQVSISQNCPEPLEFIAYLFGGTVSARTFRYKDGRRAMYGWQASSGVAGRFLMTVLPFLIVKRKQAELAIEFRGTFGPQHVKGGQKRLASDVLARRVELAEKIKQMRIDDRTRNERLVMQKCGYE